MEYQELAQYVAGRIRAGATKLSIKEELLSIGWTEEEAEGAYRAGVIALGAPVPTEGNRPTASRPSSTVDVVINFFSFILLGISAGALGTLYFQVINSVFPDALDRVDLYTLGARTSTIHYSIAALIIAFPLYYLSMRLWFRKFREDEGRAESKLSKWLTYLVLLVTAVTMVGDLITVVYTLLQGEVTVRFFLKALTIFVIAGAIFGFYYFERRKIQYRVDIPRSLFLAFGRGVAGLVALALILGFFTGGSPETARKMSLDQTRSEALNQLSSCIENYAGSLGALPASLDDLRRSSTASYCAQYMTDPETNEMYDYRVVTPSRPEGAGRVGEYELCATFALPSSGQATSTLGMPYGMNLWYEHGAGRTCQTVSAQLLAPLPPGQNPSLMQPVY